MTLLTPAAALWCATVMLATPPAPLALSSAQRRQACQHAERFAPAGLLVSAIAHKESRYRAAARGTSGECGATQVLPRVGAVRCAALDQPDTAARATGRLLRRWMRASRGDLFRAVAAYNAGYAALARTCATSSNPSRCERGRKYAQDVFAILRAYEAAAGLARLLTRG